MRHCPFCGEEIEIGLETCPKCGEDLTRPAKPSASRIPRLFHPFAVMGYLVLVSLLIVFLQLWHSRGKTPSQESATVQPSMQPPGEDAARPDNINEADRKYMEIWSYEQETKPLFDYLVDTEARLNGPDANSGPAELKTALQRLEEFSNQAKGFVSPVGLGTCQGAVKQSIEDAKNAVNSLLRYQSAKDPQSKTLAAGGFKSSRDQRLICQSLLELVTKQLEPGLSHSKSALQKEAPEWRRLHMPRPGQPSPSPSSPAPAPAATPAPEPSGTAAPEAKAPEPGVKQETKPAPSGTGEENPQSGATAVPGEGETIQP